MRQGVRAQIQGWIAVLEGVEVALDYEVAQERRRRYRGRAFRWVPAPEVRHARERIHARLLALRRQLHEVE